MLIGVWEAQVEVVVVLIRQLGESAKRKQKKAGLVGESGECGDRAETVLERARQAGNRRFKGSGRGGRK